MTRRILNKRLRKKEKNVRSLMSSFLCEFHRAELNDFTFISPRGRSVPDYIYCPADHIQYCTLCSVLKVSCVIDQFDHAVPNSLPDHSILLSEFDISCSAPSVPRVPSNSGVPNRSKMKKNCTPGNHCTNSK